MHAVCALGKLLAGLYAFRTAVNTRFGRLDIIRAMRSDTDAAPVAAPTLAEPVAGAASRARVLTLPMGGLLVAVGFGWAAELLVQATLPLLILDRGGDASLVGFVAAAYALPTLVLRPIIGRRIDRLGHGGPHVAGAVLLVLAPLGFLVASVAVLPVARFLQGLGWAMFGTANNVVLVRLAPADRRGQASAWFNGMWALGFVFGPPIGLVLYLQVGPELPFIVASALACAALASATWLRRRVPAAGVAAEPGEPGRGNRMARFLEPAAVPTMTVLATFMAANTLFLAFAPVYARSIGAPDLVLAAYFPVYGGILAIGQLLTGGLSDRFGRRRTILAGTALGGTGLMLATLADGWTLFAGGAACFALAAAIVNPAAAAATIDRVPPGRSGVAMATFSIGYQLAAGVGGAAWGILISAHGFPAPFIVAFALQLVCAAVAMRFLGAPRR